LKQHQTGQTGRSEFAGTQKEILWPQSPNTWGAKAYQLPPKIIRLLRVHILFAVIAINSKSETSNRELKSWKIAKKFPSAVVHFWMRLEHSAHTAVAIE